MFKERFIKLCAERGVSPSSVVKKIGISSAAFSQWTDKTVPRETTVIKIADYFGVDPSYFFEDEKKEKPIEYDGLSEKRKALMDFALSVPEDKAEMILRVMKSILGDE